MHTFKLIKLSALFLSFVLILMSSACTTDVTSETSGTISTTTIDETDVVSQATLNRYRVNEIQAYQGFRLDPAVGPADNSIKGVQVVDLKDYFLTVDGKVGNNLELKYDDVIDMPSEERLIILVCVTGWDATVLWKGVRIEDLIDLAGGADEDANTVIFHCVDGYTTSLPLFAVEQYDLLLAYQANGIDLPPELGYPFIVIAEDRYGYKWARWVDKITLSSNSEYKGYWESRGYPNDAFVTVR